MTVEQVVPSPCRVELAEMLADLKQSDADLEPFADEVMSFCSDFSTRLLRDAEARRHPELQALGFWMRKAELVRMREEFRALGTPRTVRVPRGLVFHVPPANVDTIFVYSWLVAVITGNRNIIRLSPRASLQTGVMCRLFNDTLQEASEAVARNTVMLRYGHEEEITAQISAAADVRILWGGDATINTIRRIPLAPHATELTFPDRYSFAVIRAADYLAADPARRQKLADDFFNDIFWFDQMACSSPRLVVWQGEAAESEQASAGFLALLTAAIERKGYAVQPQTRLSRFIFACAAAMDEKATYYQDLEKVTILSASSLQELSRDHCGGGLLFQQRIGALDELVPFVAQRDQTLTYFGYDPAEMRALAAQLNGRGVDRIVPIGQALQFHRFWDGYDLLQELTRHVYIGS